MQGIGWWLAERNIAQISLNITDMDVTPMHVAYEEAKADAEKMNIAVTGSELVRMIGKKMNGKSRLAPRYSSLILPAKGSGQP